jgi:hypothetical protein
MDNRQQLDGILCQIQPDSLNFHDGLLFSMGNINVQSGAQMPMEGESIPSV